MFFKKKVLLKEALSNAVDIHNHVLPGIDDGASDLATTQQMLALYTDLGYQKVIATPHTMMDYYGNDKTKILQTLDQTIAGLQGDQPLQKAASEYMLDDGFMALLEKGELLFLKDKILLTEFSYFQMPHNAHDLVFAMRQQDIVPILAHPERYAYIKTLAEYEDLKSMGFDFQLNLLSLSGHYGKDAQKKAELLLSKDLYDYSGTDAHRIEHLEKLSQLKLASKVFDQVHAVIERTNQTFKGI